MKYLLTLFLGLLFAVPAPAQYVYVYVYGGSTCPAPTPPPAPAPTPTMYRPAYSYAPSGGCNGHSAGCNGGQPGNGYRMPAATPVQYVPQVGESVQPYPQAASLQYAPEPQPQAPEPVYQVVRAAPAVAAYTAAPVVYAQPAVATYAAALPRAPVVAGPRFRRGVTYGSAHTAAGYYGGGFARAVVCGPGG
jgi:hypothetical protein